MRQRAETEGNNLDALFQNYYAVVRGQVDPWFFMDDMLMLSISHLLSGQLRP
jgi:hypothetical protein